MAKRRLGRGLDGMLPTAPPKAAGGEAAAPAKKAQGFEANIEDVHPNREQPRTRFDDAKLDELAASIRHLGVLEPILVRERAGQPGYEIIAGERRWRAAQRAGLKRVPVFVRELGTDEAFEAALVENLQREDLNPVEEARAYQKLSDDEGMTQAEIAKLVDKSRSHVANFQRLLALPDTILAFLAEGSLSMGHARALIGREEATELARKAVSEGLSVREMEALTRKPRSRQTAENGSGDMPETGGNADIAAVQSHLEEFLGMPVKISTDATPNTGSVTIRFRTLDQLDLICQRLTGGDI